MRDAFQLYQVPSFCGGRILTGFHHCDETTEEKLFEELFKVMPPSMPNGSFGIVYAITNNQQVKGAEFLKKIGFKPMVVSDKYGGNKTSAPCTTWFGMWHDDVQPAMLKIEAEITVKRLGSTTSGGSLRKQFGTTPTAPPQEGHPYPMGTRMRINRTFHNNFGETSYRSGHTFTIEGMNADSTHYLTSRILNSVGNLYRVNSFGSSLQVRMEDCEPV